MHHVHKIELSFNTAGLSQLLHVLNIPEHETRIVGGAVRDKICMQEPKDLDLITTILPKEVIKILRNNNIPVIPTGIKFGTVTAYIEGNHFEITTLREDIQCYGRKARVLFTNNFYQDAKRRDFTINAMSYNTTRCELYDYFQGYEDIKNKAVKFIGDPIQRIEEDYLRILRFFRFAAKYSNVPDSDGLSACIARKDKIRLLSPERIISEFNKILLSEGSYKILEVMQINEILSEISPELSWDIDTFKQLLTHTISIFPHAINNLELRYITLLNNNNWELMHSELFRLRLSNREIRKIYYLKYYDDMFSQGVNLNYLIKLVILDQKTDFVSLLCYMNAIKKISSEQAVKFFNQYKNYTGLVLPINGDDLKDKFSGVEIGVKLQKAKEIWIESDFTLSKEDLLSSI